LLRPGDALVVNDTPGDPARLRAGARPRCHRRRSGDAPPTARRLALARRS
jgi:hypothetical protein